MSRQRNCKGTKGVSEIATVFTNNVYCKIMFFCNFLHRHVMVKKYTARAWIVTWELVDQWVYQLTKHMTIMPPQKLDIKKNYEKSYCTTVGLVIPKLQPNRPAQLLIFKNLVSTYCCNFSLKIEITLILQVKKSYHISVFTKPLISVVALSPYLSSSFFLIFKI